MKKTLSALGISLLPLTMVASTAFAVSPSPKPVRAALEQRMENVKTTALARACQAREAAVKKQLEQLVKLATNMQEVFDRHTQSVEDYYSNTVLPSGKTVSNYTTLVNDISTKKTAVQAAVTKAQSDVAAFSCEGTNPKESVAIFRKDMQAVKQALKNYRTSVKNLVVAVHRVAQVLESPKPSSSPEVKENE
jgi:hypothetical protein